MESPAAASAIPGQSIRESAIDDHHQPAREFASFRLHRHHGQPPASPIAPAVASPPPPAATAGSSTSSAPTFPLSTSQPTQRWIVAFTSDSAPARSAATNRTGSIDAEDQADGFRAMRPRL